MDKHVTLVASFQIGFGVLGILAAVTVWAVVVGGGLMSGDEEVLAITAFIGSAIAFFLMVTSIPGIIGGLGLLKRRPWARILVLIISVLDLVNIPIGTALGIYSIWVLLNEETRRLFVSTSNA